MKIRYLVVFIQMIVMLLVASSPGIAACFGHVNRWTPIVEYLALVDPAIIVIYAFYAWELSDIYDRRP